MEDKQVKIWHTDSVHPTFEKADTRRNGIPKEGLKEVKVRKQARGFVVKVWHGHWQKAPDPKQKPTRVSGPQVGEGGSGGLSV